MLAGVLALGCEYITGALEPVADADTENAVDEAVGESTGAPETTPVTTSTAGGSGTSSPGTSGSPTDDIPPPGTDDEGGGSTSTGGEHDAADASGTAGGSSGGIGETANAGDCCKPGDGTGCHDPAIADCVCAIDPWCCEQEWDQVCADLVEDGGCAQCSIDPFQTEDTSCCTSHTSPSCDDTEVAECVCAVDGFCCSVFWDQVCVDKVDELGCGPCDAGVDMMNATDTEGGYESTGPASTGTD